MLRSSEPDPTAFGSRTFAQAGFRNPSHPSDLDAEHGGGAQATGKGPGTLGTFNDLSPRGTGRRRSRSEASLESSNADPNTSELQAAIGLGPRKRPCRTDPLVHHGRHFGRTIQAFCRVQTLIKNGMIGTFQLEISHELVEEDLSGQEKHEHAIYKDLLRLSPEIEKRLCTGSEEDIFHIADLIQKGSSSARADDTKGLKGVILDWITPPGEALRPPLLRNVKTDRGFFHDTTGKLLCPIGLEWSDPATKEGLRTGTITVAGDQWPLFLYKDNTFDRENVWKGLFRSNLLVFAFRHIFTSPSSVDRQPRATRSGNARIHGMESVTEASIAYVATQVRFALSSSPVFSRTDLVSDSERFYGSIIDCFNNPKEKEPVERLLVWWDRQIFPAQNRRGEELKKGSVLALMQEQRNRQADVAQRG
ncbi:hypothetical protein BKA70DRAFT_1104875 [Coprinopsis sp. MPI-PUGE-AT-0042]|nr:hypothetical protein BKA70DRAFT_1104875 [Coprinopsis sp. MPI-PUGE-AT-0042]